MLWGGARLPIASRDAVKNLRVNSETIYEMYFCLAPRFQLHLFPDGGNVFLRSKPESRTEKEISYRLNMTAASILRHCDGTLGIRDLLCAVARHFDGTPEVMLEQMVEFLRWGCESGVLDVHPKPQDKEVCICGSQEFFVPMHLMVELTDKCNLSCRHCYRNSSSSQGEILPLNLLLRILNEFAELGLKTIELTGGEPTLHPDFTAVVRYCAGTFDFVSILTNGYVITAELLNEIEAHKDKVVFQVDLDGHKPQIHDWLRGKKGSFEKAAHSIGLISKREFMCRAVMNLHAANCRYIEDVAMLARKLGATWYSFSPILAVGRAESLELLSGPQFAKCVELTREFKERYPGFFFSVDESQIERLSDPKKNCGAGWRSQVLGPTGRLRPCAMLAETRFNFGDLSELSCKDLLSQQRERLSSFFELQPPDYQMCEHCSYFQFCAGCMVRPLSVIDGKGPIACAWADQTDALAVFGRSSVTRNEGSRHHEMRCPAIPNKGGAR
jgi:radical SAM protein with 4Fe4S-binding SPASM domain